MHFIHPRKEQPDPKTPLFTSDRDTEQLERADYFRRLRDSLEDTGENIAISAPPRTEFVMNGLEGMPHLLIYGGICHHIDQRTDRIPPREVYVNRDIFTGIAEQQLRQYSDGFTGEFSLGAYDGTNSIPIIIRLDSMIGEALPSNTVICIHAGGARADR